MKISLTECLLLLSGSFAVVTAIQIIWPSPSWRWIVLHYTVGTVAAFVGHTLAARREKK